MWSWSNQDVANSWSMIMSNFWIFFKVLVKGPLAIWIEFLIFFFSIWRIFWCLCRKQVQASRQDAEKDGVVVPTTMEEYCMKAKPLRPAQDSIEMDDFYDDDCYDIDDMDDDSEGSDEELSDNEENEKKYDDAEDSGNGESWKSFTSKNNLRQVHLLPLFSLNIISDVNDNLSSLFNLSLNNAHTCLQLTFIIQNLITKCVRISARARSYFCSSSTCAAANHHMKISRNHFLVNRK